MITKNAFLKPNSSTNTNKKFNNIPKPTNTPGKVHLQNIKIPNWIKEKYRPKSTKDNINLNIKQYDYKLTKIKSNSKNKISLSSLKINEFLNFNTDYSRNRLSETNTFIKLIENKPSRKDLYKSNDEVNLRSIESIKEYYKKYEFLNRNKLYGQYKHLTTKFKKKTLDKFKVISKNNSCN